MQEAEELIVDALSRYGIPPAASRNLIQRARRKSGLGDRPADWVRLAEGPLIEEIQAIIPIFQGTGDYEEALERLREWARRQRAVAPPPKEAPPPERVRKVDLSSAEARERLLSELAREEGTVGVALIRNGRAEMRFPGASASLPRLLYAAHQLVARRRPYRVAYLVVQEAQVFLRPLGEYVVAVVTKRGANLGRVLTRLSELQPEGGSE